MVDNIAELPQKKHPTGKVSRQRGGIIPKEEQAEMVMTVIKKPDITVREFGQKFGYAPVTGTDGEASEDHNRGAVVQLSRIKRTLSELKIIPSVNEILEQSLHIVREGGEEQLRRIVEAPDSLSMTDISVAVDKAFKRSQLLQGKATDKVTIELAEIKDMNESDLDSILSDYSVREVS